MKSAHRQTLYPSKLSKRADRRYTRRHTRKLLANLQLQVTIYCNIYVSHYYFLFPAVNGCTGEIGVLVMLGVEGGGGYSFHLGFWSAYQWPPAAQCPLTLSSIHTWPLHFSQQTGNMSKYLCKNKEEKYTLTHNTSPTMLQFLTLKREMMRGEVSPQCKMEKRWHWGCQICHCSTIYFSFKAVESTPWRGEANKHFQQTRGSGCAR